ncbi:MAG: aldose 1-epimerase family protein [Beijerinckiaceae bacterium]
MDADSLVLTAGDARATLSNLGAEAIAWSIGGNELLWRKDQAIWDRTAPILFPVVGWCRGAEIRVSGQTYPMPVHGFASSMPFELEYRTGDSAVFVLRDSAVTRWHYPFAFALRVHYALAPDALSVSLTVTNEDDKTLFYSCGLHPGFAMPFAGGALEDYRIEFEEAEGPHVPVISPDGLFSSATRLSPVAGRRLRLGREVFAQEALCFLDAKSRELALVRPGRGRISMRVESFPHLAVWSRPGAPFVCLEAWAGHGDPVGYEGELAGKPGIIALPAGGVGGHSAVMRWSKD